MVMARGFRVCETVAPQIRHRQAALCGSPSQTLLLHTTKQIELPMQARIEHGRCCQSPAIFGRVSFATLPNDHDKPMRPAPAFEASMARSLFFLGSPL